MKRLDKRRQSAHNEGAAEDETIIVNQTPRVQKREREGEEVFRFPMRYLFFPTRYVGRVTALTPQRLADWGITSLLLDADCTLKRYPEPLPEEDILRWLEQTRAAGISLALVSNGLGPRISRLAGELKLPFTARALKPLPGGVRRAMRENNMDPKHTAMVGDQLFADIWAGNLAGIQTILVDPIHPEEEHWFTRLKRPPERLMKLPLKRDDLP